VFLPNIFRGLFPLLALALALLISALSLSLIFPTGADAGVLLVRQPAKPSLQMLRGSVPATSKEREPVGVMGVPSSPLSLAQASAAPKQAEKPAPEKRAPTAGGTALFRRHCARCHDQDGRGRTTRESGSEIPDFTNSAWQKQRSDPQLLVSILDGKGAEMPPWRGKVSEEQARGLVATVRTFAPTRSRPEDSSPTDFDKNYRRLQKELDELQRQFRELSEASPGSAPSRPSEAGRRTAPPRSAPAATAMPTSRELFRQHCAKCHGADGTGSLARDSLTEIPNFTDASWQARRSDEQLLAGILKGKGAEMPPWRDKISAEQAHSLVTYVRAFRPTRGSSGQKE
jgi:mono/diheme cytochrome c family protein